MGKDEKIIIHNRSSYSMERILPMVYEVVKMGRISDDGKAYCYLVSGLGLVVSTVKRDKGDTFYILDDRKEGGE